MIQFLGHRALRESRPPLQESRSERRDSRLARGWLLTFERYCIVHVPLTKNKLKMNQSLSLRCQER